MLNLSRLSRISDIFRSRPVYYDVTKYPPITTDSNSIILQACVHSRVYDKKKTWITLLCTQESQLPICISEQMMCIEYLREKGCISVATTWLWQVFVLQSTALCVRRQAWQEHKYRYCSVASHLTYARSSSESQE